MISNYNTKYIPYLKIEMCYHVPNIPQNMSQAHYCYIIPSHVASRSGCRMELYIFFYNCNMCRLQDIIFGKRYL